MTDKPEKKPAEVKGKTKITRQHLLLGIAILVIAGVGFVLKPSGLDKALVEKELQNFAKALAENPGTKEYNPKLTYGAIEIGGGFSTRYAVVRDTKLSVTDKGSEIVISTPEVKLVPLSKDLSSGQVLFGDLDVQEAGALLAKIDFNDTVAYNYSYGKVDGKKITKFNFNLKDGMKVTGADGKVVEVSYDNDPTIEGQMDLEGFDAQNEFTLKNFKVKEAETGEVFNAETLSIKSKNVAAEGSKRNMSTQVELSNVLPVGLDTLYGALSVKGDFDFTADMASLSNAATLPADSQLKIRSLEIGGKEFKANVTADLNTTAVDPLPAGIANLTVQNFAYLYNNIIKVAGPETTQLVDAILSKATGSPIADLKDLSLDFKREPGGTSYIGKATFEEVAALAMPLIMQQMMAAPASGGGFPATDSSEAPAVAPVEGETTPADAAPVTAPADEAAPAAGGAAPAAPQQ